MSAEIDVAREDHLVRLAAQLTLCPDRRKCPDRRRGPYRSDRRNNAPYARLERPRHPSDCSRRWLGRVVKVRLGIGLQGWRDWGVAPQRSS